MRHCIFCGRRVGMFNEHVRIARSRLNAVRHTLGALLAQTHLNALLQAAGADLDS